MTKQSLQPRQARRASARHQPRIHLARLDSACTTPRSHRNCDDILSAKTWPASSSIPASLAPAKHVHVHRNDVLRWAHKHAPVPVARGLKGRIGEKPWRSSGSIWNRSFHPHFCGAQIQSGQTALVSALDGPYQGFAYLGTMPISGRSSPSRHPVANPKFSDAAQRMAGHTFGLNARGLALRRQDRLERHWGAGCGLRAKGFPRAGPRGVPQAPYHQ